MTALIPKALVNLNFWFETQHIVLKWVINILFPFPLLQKRKGAPTPIIIIFVTLRPSSQRVFICMTAVQTLIHGGTGIVCLLLQMKKSRCRSVCNLESSWVYLQSTLEVSNFTDVRHCIGQEDSSAIPVWASWCSENLSQKKKTLKCKTASLDNNARIYWFLFIAPCYIKKIYKLQNILVALGRFL